MCRAVEAEVGGSDGLQHRYQLDENALALCKQKYVKLVLASYELISERRKEESHIPVGVVPAVFCREFRLPLGILALYNHHYFNHAEGSGNYDTVIKWVDFVKMMCIFILKCAPKSDKVAMLIRILRIKRVSELDKTFLIECIQKSFFAPGAVEYNSWQYFKLDDAVLCVWNNFVDRLRSFFGSSSNTIEGGGEEREVDPEELKDFMVGHGLEETEIDVFIDYLKTL